jgi:hypothetical protein
VTITSSLRSGMTAAGQSWSNRHSLPRPRMIGIRHAFDLIAAWPPFKRASPDRLEDELGPYYQRDYVARYAEGLRAAGLPD